MDMASLEVRYSYTDPLTISRENYRDLADLWVASMPATICGLNEGLPNHVFTVK